jgi:hypothetical protein
VKRAAGLRRQTRLPSAHLQGRLLQRACEQPDDARANAVPPSAALPKRVPVPWQAPRDTPVPAAVRELVLARDCHACVCCGKSVVGETWVIYFRKPERLGGPPTPDNLITVLRSCGERIGFLRDARDEASGYRLRPWQDPELVPVGLTLSAGQRATVWLTPQGLLSFEPPSAA